MIALLLECSVRAALVAAGVGVIIGALRMTAAALRHAAWFAVLVAMLLLPAYLEWGPKATIQTLPVFESPRLIEPLAREAEPITEMPTAVARTSPAPLPSQPKPQIPWTPELLFVMVYSLVAALLLTRLLHGTLQASALLRRASLENGFLVNPRCACPITAGWLRPRIVLPSNWTEWPSPELEAILKHEREHVRRRDPLVQWLAALNRSLFWFHPLAWWLERKLASLAEEACDAAVVGSGQDPQEYAEYLLRQARALERSAGKRVVIQGVGMGSDGTLPGRISKLLNWQAAPQTSRRRIATAAALVISISALFVACQIDRIEKPLPGQPTMNELMHRRADENIRRQAQQDNIVARARSLSAAEAQVLVAELKLNPDDGDTYRTVVRHYELKQNVADLDSLRLWYIEHHPDGKVPPGNIDPHFDKTGYDRGKAQWLANLKKPHVSADEYSLAANFLDGGDQPLAESVLEAGKKAFPNDRRWPSILGRHYAQVLMGATEPITDMGVIRRADPQEAGSPYAQSVRARLMESSDAAVLAHTAQYLLLWSSGGPAPRGAAASMSLAHTLLDRAYSLQGDSELVARARQMMLEIERSRKAIHLINVSPAEQASLNDSDKILLARKQVEFFWFQSKPDDAAAKARELLSLAERNPSDPLYGDAVFEANIVLGKVALRHGDRRAAARNLLAAAATPGSDKLRNGQFEMNLPRALIDRGERSSVAEFLDRMAPKTTRSKQFQDWAAQIRKGINPDLTPTFSMPRCTQDPC